MLMTKHFIFDFVLQTPYQYRNKGIYGHPGGILHSGLHAFGSIPALLVVPPSFVIGAAIVVVEFLIHYHVDWTKERIERRLGLTPANARYYFVLGADQLIHQLTYVAIIAVLISAR